MDESLKQSMSHHGKTHLHEVDFNHAFNRILRIQEAKRARLEALAQGRQLPTGHRLGTRKIPVLPAMAAPPISGRVPEPPEGPLPKEVGLTRIKDLTPRNQDGSVNDWVLGDSETETA
jgi:hypothetical protein